jgi:hypothetical protein
MIQLIFPLGMSLVQEAEVWGLNGGKIADEDENSVRKEESEKGELEILRLGTEVSSTRNGGRAELLEMTTQTKTASITRRSISCNLHVR